MMKNIFKTILDNKQPLTVIARSQNCLFSSFRSEDLTIKPQGKPKMKPPVSDLGFGKHFTDNMLRIRWNQKNGWGTPVICPLDEFRMHPAAKVLHYAQELYEGMKAYRGVDNEIRLFRPMHNMSRMVLSAKRTCFPDFEPDELLKCIQKLVQLDQDWVPHAVSSSLYIRPTMIGIEPTLGLAPSLEVELFVILSPVGPYYSSGLIPVNLMADPKYVRACPGGTGYAKMGSNYAPTLYVQNVAAQHNCHQALWLYGPDEEITEVGSMNIFVMFKKDNGRLELVTPPLDSGVILPGVTRRSVLEIAQELNEFDVSERKVTMKDILEGARDGTLVEMFGTGTAAIVTPVANIFYDGVMTPIPIPESSFSNRIMSKLSDIYYGRIQHPWGVPVEDWSSLETEEQLRLDNYKENMEARISG